MTIDLAALKTALETDPRYDADVRAGRNRNLVILLDDPEVGKTKVLKVGGEDVLNAIGEGVRGLIDKDRETLRLFTDRIDIDFSKPSIDAEIREIFKTDTDVLARLDTLTKRTQTYGEAFGGTISIDDIRLSVRQISKSFIVSTGQA